MNSKNHQYHPLPAEFEAAGIVGACLYIIIIILSCRTLYIGIKSRTSRRFFAIIIAMAICELPRYFDLIIREVYNSKLFYCLHICGTAFFFVSFSIVCHQWSGLLRMGSYSRILYGSQGLIVVNIVFGIVDILGIIACSRATSLKAFFYSYQFQIFTLVEAFKNVVYSSLLAFYGLKLVRRFWHYSSIERISPSSFDNSIFMEAVIRLTVVLIVSTICFLLRVCMLGTKIIALESSRPITTPTFTLFGVAWFFCSDFIPRSVPSFAFITLMQTRRISKDSRRLHQLQVQQEDDFQFVRLAGCDDDCIILDGKSDHPVDYPTSPGNNDYGSDDDDDDDSLDSTGDPEDLFTVTLNQASRDFVDGNPVEL